MAKIELDILNPEKFKTLEEIRDFVTGEGAVALHYAIGEALSPTLLSSAADELQVELKGELRDAREAAAFVSRDLRALAKGAIESEGDLEAFNSGSFLLGKERRALLFIALRNGDASYPIQRGIIKYLADGSRESVTGSVQT